MTRPRPNPVTDGGRLLRSALKGATALLLVLFATEPAWAQFNLVAPGDTAQQADPNSRILLEADQADYNNKTGDVSASGNVEVYYEGNTLYAQHVQVNQKADRMQAEGGVRLTETDGNVVTAKTLTGTTDLKDGVMTAVRADTSQRTRIAAEQATRTGGETTVFKKAIYTACQTCADDPKSAPVWQISAQTITHDKNAQMLYYRDATLDIWGVPVLYSPYLSQPDPTVRRKTGFLLPTLVNGSNIGTGARIPYFWALAPNYDLTVALTPLTTQGLLGDVEWRQRSLDGEYNIYASGIFQKDPSAFDGTSGNGDARGMISSNGKYWINPQWNWGWNLGWTSDPTYTADYAQPVTSTVSGTEILNQLFLQGVGDRNYFDIRGYAFRVLQQNMDLATINPPEPFTPYGTYQQEKQSIVHPVMDYNGVFDESVAGGELSWKSNLTSLNRDMTDAFTVAQGDDLVTRFRGVSGTFSRYTAYLQWRRQFTDSLGQIYTPFTYLQADVYSLQDVDPAVTQLANNSVAARAMPAIGFEYRYPWLIAASFGNQVIEPVGQIIARPNEQYIGKLPNEDAQSIVFDDTTLFEWDKFSGFDRVEGGTRANVGLQYTLQTNGYGALTGMFGRSFLLAGENSFAIPDILDSTDDSGLETNASDYVARLAFDTQQGMRFGGRIRLDNENFSMNRAEVAASGTSGPLTTQVTYAFLGRQPGLGIDDDREEIHTSASLRIIDEWRTFGSIRYDILGRDVVADGFGIAYDGESLSLSLSLMEDRSGASGMPVDRTAYLRVGFRTLGDLSYSSSVGGE